MAELKDCCDLPKYSHFVFYLDHYHLNVVLPEHDEYMKNILG